MMLQLNGSRSLAVCNMNVGTGGLSILGRGGGPATFYFMARNVGLMGRMWPSSNSSPTINDTLTMTYAGESRLTDHVMTTIKQSGMIVTTDFYYDQATGIMVEWRSQSVQTNGSLQTNSTQMMNITSSSVWAIHEFSPSIVVPPLVVGTIPVATAFALIGKHMSKSAFKTRTLRL
jgi:hypothetical protein